MPSTGTYQIFKQLRWHWIRRSDPIYRADLKRRASATYLKDDPLYPIGKRRSRIDTILVLFGAIFLLLIFAMGSFPVMSPLTICGIALLLAGAVWLGYLRIIVASSRLIVEEKENETWDTILTVPFSWDHLIFAKLAAILHSFFFDIMLWLQAFFVMAILGFDLYIGIKQMGYGPSQGVIWGVLVAVVVALVAIITMTIGRIQDYILLSLIGSVISVLSTSARIAEIAAIFLGLIYLMVWTIPIILIGPVIDVGNWPWGILAFAGFTSRKGAVALGLLLPGAVVTAGILILLREVLIRKLFDWLTRHLSER